MALRSDDIYTSVVFNGRTPNIQWSIDGPLSGDLTAGITAALLTLISELLNNPSKQMPKPVDATISIINRDPRYNIMINNNTHDFALFSEYIIAAGLLPQQAIVQNIPSGYFAWGIYNPNLIHKLDLTSYDLYMFQSFEFIQGFISVCDAFQVDFREYSLGLPFRTEQGRNVFYGIEGYDVDSVIQKVREPAPTGAYYTYNYEQYDRTGAEPQVVTDEDQGDYPRDFE
ncbi:Hypothetical protein HVR_LOCUS644 [uncultured virus]|nr:Hypothetical protein HVR_LOCUS644 [uncultured virus]